MSVADDEPIRARASGIEHLITVGRLRELLSLLRDDDVLIPNKVANLKIERDGAYVGYVDLLEGQQCVELFDDEETAEKSTTAR